MEAWMEGHPRRLKCDCGGGCTRLQRGAKGKRSYRTFSSLLLLELPDEMTFYPDL